MSIQGKESLYCKPPDSISALHFYRYAHLLVVGRSPGTAVARRLAPRRLEQLGPAGTPCASPGDADHCGDREKSVNISRKMAVWSQHLGRQSTNILLVIAFVICCEYFLNEYNHDVVCSF